MYYKLVDDCIRFQTMGIEMLGNPRTQLLIGLDEAGSALANRLLVGCEVDIAHLSESEQALMDALTKMHQFTSCEQTQKTSVKSANIVIFAAAVAYIEALPFEDIWKTPIRYVR